jgi:hypothetical protein
MSELHGKSCTLLACTPRFHELVAGRFDVVDDEL